jgi:peptidoglycan/xylan/chitin deacetylase (PgdA/CDA1 family)
MNKRDMALIGASALLYYSGLMQVINWLHRHSGQRLLILNYHQASGGELRRHLLYLRRHFHLQFVDQALEALYTTGKEQASNQDRKLPLTITFDDGYLDNYTTAYAIARELQVPITIFLISDYIGHGSAFWWFDNLVERAQVEQATIDGHTYHLNVPEDQYKMAQVIGTHLNSIVDQEQRQTYLSEMCETLSIPANATDGEPALMLSWEQVQEMQASGWVAFGGHTLHHPTLACLPGIDEARKEVADCRSLLQEKLGRSVRIFAYPHGGLQHIEVNGLLAVQQAGYEWAVSTLQGVNTPRTHPHLVRRISAHSRLHWLIIALMTSGAWDVLSYLNWHIKTHVKYRKILGKMRQCL